MKATGKMTFLKAMAGKFTIRASIMRDSGRMAKSKATDTTRLMREPPSTASGNKISPTEWVKKRGLTELCSRAITVMARRRAEASSSGKTGPSTRGSF